MNESERLRRLRRRLVSPDCAAWHASPCPPPAAQHGQPAQRGGHSGSWATGSKRIAMGHRAAPWRREGPPDPIKNPPTDTAGACMETESGTACVSYKHRPAARVRVAQKKECPIDMITNVRTYGHRTGMCMHSHKLRATEIPVTADNMGWSWK